MARWDAGCARQELLGLGAEERLACPEWVTNHFKWIVWKLAVREHVLSSQCAQKVLTQDAVMQQLVHRYNREQVLGHTPAVRALLQHDITPCAALCLLVSAIHVKHNHQQQQQNLGGEGGCAERGEQELSAPASVSLELSDGWYNVAAQPDELLSQMVLDGRLKVGTKLRFSCARISAPAGPCSPLDASARSTQLLLTYNTVSPMPWDAKLGYQRRPLSLRPLGLVHPKGGPVPCMVVVVQAKFAMQYWEKIGGNSVFRTERHQRLREQNVTNLAERAETIAEQVRAAEEAFCHRLVGGPAENKQALPNAISASPAQRVYASLVLSEGMLLVGGGGGPAALLQQEGVRDHMATFPAWSEADSQELSRLMAARRTALTEHHMAALSRAMAGQHTSRGARLSDHAVAEKSGKSPQVCGVPVQRFLLSAAVHQSAAPGSEDAEALIMLWRPQEDDDESCSLVEGGVYLATQLEPVERPSNKLGLMELRASKHSAWRQLGTAAELAGNATAAAAGVRTTNPTGMRVRWPSERPRLKVADLPMLYSSLQQHARLTGQGMLVVPFGCCLFDYVGLVVGVGAVQHSGGLHGRLTIVTQWVYLADDSSLSMHDAAAHEQQACQQQQQQKPEPWLLAVKIEGNTGSVDLLDEAHDKGQLVHFRHLQLEVCDPSARLWQATAPDTASHSRVSSSTQHRDAGVSEVSGWMSSCAAEVGAAQQHACTQARLR